MEDDSHPGTWIFFVATQHAAKVNPAVYGCTGMGGFGGIPMSRLRRKNATLALNLPNKLELKL